MHLGCTFDAKNARVEKEDEFGKSVGESKGRQVRNCLERAKAAGAWLTCMPNRLNETVLSVKNFWVFLYFVCVCVFVFVCEIYMCACVGVQFEHIFTS